MCMQILCQSIGMQEVCQAKRLIVLRGGAVYFQDVTFPDYSPYKFSILSNL